MPSAKAPVLLPTLPASITACQKPVALPSGTMIRSNVERLWARDRVALVRCGANLDAVVNHYEGLSARLGGAK